MISRSKQNESRTAMEKISGCEQTQKASCLRYAALVIRAMNTITRGIAGNLLSRINKQRATLSNSNTGSVESWASQWFRAAIKYMIIGVGLDYLLDLIIDDTLNYLFAILDISTEFLSFKLYYLALKMIAFLAVDATIGHLTDLLRGYVGPGFSNPKQDDR